MPEFDHVGADLDLLRRIEAVARVAGVRGRGLSGRHRLRSADLGLRKRRPRAKHAEADDEDFQDFGRRSSRHDPSPWQAAQTLRSSGRRRSTPTPTAARPPKKRALLPQLATISIRTATILAARRMLPFSSFSPFFNRRTAGENGRALDLSGEFRFGPPGKTVENGGKRSKNGGPRLFAPFAAPCCRLVRGGSGVAQSAESRSTTDRRRWAYATLPKAADHFCRFGRIIVPTLLSHLLWSLEVRAACSRWGAV